MYFQKLSKQTTQPIIFNFMSVFSQKIVFKITHVKRVDFILTVIVVLLWCYFSFIYRSTGLFVFLYALFYYFKRSNMSGALQTIEFFGYTFLTCYVFFLMLGTVSFFASLHFVRYIYVNLKMDWSSDGNHFQRELGLEILWRWSLVRDTPVWLVVFHVSARFTR